MTTNTTRLVGGYLTLVAAAEYLGVDVRTVRRMISRGDLAGFRYGRRMIRVRVADLDSILTRIPTATARRTR